MELILPNGLKSNKAKKDFVPDFLLKEIDESRFKELPTRIQVIFLALKYKGHVSDPFIVKDAKKNHPEYFEKL